MKTIPDLMALYAIIYGGQISGAQIGLPHKTPVNAVAAQAALVFTGNAEDNETIKIANIIYTFQEAIAAEGARAKADLTFTGVAANGEIVTVDDIDYEFVTALTEAKAAGTLTVASGGDKIQAGNTVTIGTKTYTFVSELTPTEGQVLIGANDTAALLNLKDAINRDTPGDKDGVKYKIAAAHPDVEATASDATTLSVRARVIGDDGNLIATTETEENEATDVAWGAVKLANGADSVENEVLVEATAEACIDNLVAAFTAGAGAGVKYSTATIEHPSVTGSKAASNTFRVTADEIGDIGDAIEVATDITNASWSGATLTGGEAEEAPYDVLIGVSPEATIDNLVAAINKASGEGTTYGTDTVAHPDVTAAKSAADTMMITAKVKGTAAHGIALESTVADAAWENENPENGIDGTPGLKYEICYDGEEFYFCTAINTVADTNWKILNWELSDIEGPG